MGPLSVCIIFVWLWVCVCVFARRVYRWPRRRLRSGSWRASWGRRTWLARRTITWSWMPCEKRRNTSQNCRLWSTTCSKVCGVFLFVASAECFQFGVCVIDLLQFWRLYLCVVSRKRIRQHRRGAVGVQPSLWLQVRWRPAPQHSILLISWLAWNKTQTRFLLICALFCGKFSILLQNVHLKNNISVMSLVFFSAVCLKWKSPTAKRISK